MLLVLFIIFSGLVATNVQMNRPITLLEGSVGARCVDEAGDELPREYSTGKLAIPCPSRWSSIRCDFANAEPVDLTGDEACETRLLPVRGQSVAVAARGSGNIRVQWLNFFYDPSGPSAVTVVATRVANFVKPVALRVASRDYRFIRFLPSEASPITVSAAELLLSSDWALPEPMPGGEFVARVGVAVVVPKGYRLLGDVVREAMPDRGVLVFRGVPRGQYELVPVYEAGVRGRSRKIVIENGQSTTATLPPEPVGAVRISIEDSRVCREAGSLTLSTISARHYEGAVLASAERVLNLRATGDCVQTIAGLRAGQYEVAYHSATRQIAVRRFEIVPQAVATVTLAAPRVKVFGTVTMNGRPSVGTVVGFVPVDDPLAVPVSADTDASGAYAVTLPGPGLFHVRFRGARFGMLGNEHQVAVAAGDNFVDWPLEGGTVRVFLKGWNRSTPVDIELTHLRMVRPGRTGENLRLLPSESLPVVFDGVGYGQYAIQAVEHEPNGSAVNRVAGSTLLLDAAHPDATVELELREPRVVLRVVDRTGNIVTNSGVFVRGKKIEASAPGVFALRDVAPGGFATIMAPGFTPVCRLIPNDSMDIEVDPGRSLRLEFLGTPAVPVIRGMLSWPASDCPMPLDRFDVTRVIDAPNEFLIKNFPSDKGVVYIPGPFDAEHDYQPITPDQNGVIRVRLLRENP